MKRSLAKLLVAMLLMCQAIGAAAAVKWLEKEHNFGAFREDDGRVHCDFRFVNTGNEPVAIVAARASCGCTTTDYTKEPVEPSDTGTVTVSYNPIGRPGKFGKSVTVFIADANGESRHLLQVMGVVIGSSNTLMSRYPVDAGPLKLRTTLLPFGTITRGGAKSNYIEIYNASDRPLTLNWLHVPSYMRLASSAEAIPPGEQTITSVVVTPSASSLYGILTDSLLLEVPGRQEPLKINVTAIVEEDFSTLTPSQRQKAPVAALEQERLDFDRLSEQPETRKFPLANRGKSDLLVRRIYTTDPGVTISGVPDKIKKGKTEWIAVTVDPAMLPSELLNARIQIITNDPENPLQILRVVGLRQ